MQKTTAAEALKKSILVLEQRKIEEGKLLQEQFAITYQSLKPINIIRKVISDFAEPAGLKENLMQTITGLVSGYFSRKILVRSSKNPFLRLAGVFLQYGVTNFVAKHSDTIKTIGTYYLNQLTNISRDNKV